jgi:putative two-component system response regulator
MRTREATGRRILVADDDPWITSLLSEILVAEGHAVVVAHDGRTALDQVTRSRPDLVLLDIDMPVLDGYEVCRQLKGDPATRHIPIVMVTAQADLQTRIEACELGADDFLTKPFLHTEVLTRCRSMLRLKSLIDERDSAETVVFALARTVEAKSPYTHGHSERVRDYALELAGQVNLPRDQWVTLGKGALLHDIGKLSIPDALLDKPAALTAAEYEIVKDHTRQGARIVEPLQSLQAAVPLIRCHHERLDGRGYPDGLTGDDIPPIVRILSVADVFDSLASERPYRPAMSPDKCLQIMRENAAGGGLDPDLVEHFAAILKARRLRLPPARGAGAALPVSWV